MTVYTTSKHLNNFVTDATPTGVMIPIINGVTVNSYPYTLSAVNGYGDLIFKGLEQLIEYDDKGLAANRPVAGQTLLLTFDLAFSDGDLTSTTEQQTLTITGQAASTVPILSAVNGSSTGQTTANLSFETDTLAGNAVVGVYLSTATKPNRDQLRAGLDGDNAALVFTQSVSPVSASPTVVAASGLTSGASYKYAVQQDNGADQTAVSEAASWTQSVSATLAEQVDGLANGSTPVGRTSLNTLKTLGQIPAGVSLGSDGPYTSLTLTADNVTLEDFDLTNCRVNINGRQNAILRQCRLVSTVAQTGTWAKVRIPDGSHNALISHNDIFGSYDNSSGQEKQLIHHFHAGAGVGATCANGVIIERNHIKWFHNDGVHTAGGGIDVRWNLFGVPANSNIDIQNYDNVPGNWTTGDYVRFTSGGIFGYVAVCRVATPTTHPVKAQDTADWQTQNLPHSDYLNTRGSIGTGITTLIQYNYFKDYILGAEGVRAAGRNNFLRTDRNSGQTEPVGRMDIIGNKSDRANTGASMPISLASGVNITGPYNLSDNRIGASANGSYVTGATGLIGTWSNNTDSATGATIPQP